MRSKLLFVMFVCGFVLSAGYGDVGDMIPAVQLTATSSTSHGTYPNPMEVVNGSGMAGDAHANAWGSWFTAAADPDRWIVVDLGGTYYIGDVKVWNANESWGWSLIGFNETAFYVANMSDPGNPVNNAENWTLITTVVLTEAPGTVGYDTPDVVDLGGEAATHVALRCVTPTYAYEDDRAGLSELRFFEGVEGVPAAPVYNPDPADGAQSDHSTTTILSWETLSFDGRFPKVEGYWGTADPNFWGFTNGGGEPIQISYLADANLIGHQIDLSAIPGPLGGPISLLPNEIYYWGLKYEDPNVIGSGQEDPNAYWGNPVLLEGPAWTFDTTNKPPVVDAGPHADRWLPSAGSVKVGLDGSYTDDGLPVGGPVTYAWTETLSGGASTPTYIPNRNVEDPNIVCSTAGDYLLTLTVNDGGSGSDGDDTVLVRIFAHDDDRLRAHYQLDGNATDIAEGHPATLVDNPTWGTGQVAGAIELDGTDDVLADGYNDHVSIDDTGSDPNFQADTWENSDLIDGMTISAWMKLDEDGWSKNWEAIVTKNNSSWELQRYSGSDNLRFIVQSGVGEATSSGVTDVTSGWHQVVGVYDRNTIKIYVDGLETGSGNANPLDLEANPHNTQNWQVPKAPGKIRIGACSNVSGDLAFAGLIDQVRIFDAAVPYRAEYSNTPGIVEMYRADGGHDNCGGIYLLGDTNEDCYITLVDFAIVALDWLDCTDVADENCPLSHHTQ